MLAGRMLYGMLNIVSAAFGYRFLIQMFPEKRGKNEGNSILFILMACFAIGVQAWMGQFYYISVQSVLIYAIIHSLILTIFYKCPYQKIFVWMWFYSVTIEMLKLPLLTCKQIWWRQNVFQIDFFSWEILETIWYFLIVVAISWIQKSSQKVVVKNIRMILEEKTSVLFVFAALECSMRMVIVYTEQQSVSVGNLILDLLVFSMLEVLFWQIYHSVGHVKQVEQELERQQRAWLREQKAMKEGFVQDAKRLHDMKHVLLYLQKCLADQEIETAEEYLKTYTEQVSQSQKKIWTGFSEIDFSVNYYYQMMQEKGISFSMETDIHEIPMEEPDWMIVFGNLLDNAMTAAWKCEPQERRVHMKLQTINEMFLLQIENSMNQMPERKNGRFLSSKTEKEYHGWGIENVKQIVDKYDGDIQFSYTERSFKVEIIIYGKEEKE